MIWHIFKKDLRLLWRYALGLAVVQGLTTVAIYRMDEGVDDLQALWQFVLIGGLLGALVLIAVVVHQDAIPGVRQDWLARPIRRRDLLAAKLLFVVLWMSGPAFLTNWLAAMAHGFSWEKSLSAALAYSIPMLIGYYLPFLGFASLMRNLTETVVGVVVAIIVLVELQSFAKQAGGLRLAQFGSGTDWVVDWAELLCCCAALRRSCPYSISGARPGMHEG